LPDFSWYVTPKPDEITRWTQNVANGHKISRVYIKIPNDKYIYQYFPI
jgi:hypothetical protein